MTYRYRDIRAEFDDPDGNECGYRFYSNGDRKDLCIDSGKVIVGREVANLSSCALMEFVRKYIDVNFSRLCTSYSLDTELKSTPLSAAALAAAARIQEAANRVVKSVAQSHDDVVTLDYADLAFDLDSYGNTFWDFVDAILDGVKELPGYQFNDGDSNELRVAIDRQQTTQIQQNTQTQMM